MPKLIASWLLLVALLAGGPAAAQSPEGLAAAKELVTTMRAAEQVRLSFPLMMQQLKPVITRGNPAVERDFDAIVPAMLSAMDGRMTEFLDSIAAVYARFFSVEELKQLGEFYKAPVGQKFLQIMPNILQESMAVGQKFGQEVAVDAQTKIIEELRKRGHKL